MKIVIEGNPPRKDQHWRPIARGGRARLILTKEAREFRARARFAVLDLLGGGAVIPAGPLYAVRIDIYVNRRSRELDCPLRDVDSAASPVLDALGHAGVWDDDMQVEALVLGRHLDRERPRVEVVVQDWAR